MTQYATFNDEHELLCPRCGFNYLHQSDGPSEYAEGKNYGLAVPYWCENCGEDKASILKLNHYKGNMTIKWELP